MKTVGIITLYDSINFGAFLQGFALQKIINSNNYDSEFFRITNREDRKKRIRREILSKNPVHLLFNLKRFINFKKDQKSISISEKYYLKNSKTYSSIIIGSDEIWNLKNDSFRNLEIYFANNLNSNNIVAYAISAGNSKYEDISSKKYCVNGIKKFNSLSARDLNTKGIMEKMSNRTVNYVLDPTLLYDFSGKDNKKVYKKKFILVYTYGFSEEKIKAVKRYSKERNLELISVGFYNKWCDRCIPCGPFEFLNWVDQAEYIITDTFHGTLFSIIYRKNFIVLGKNKIKINDVLKQFKITNRIIDNPQHIDKVLSQEIDYDNVYSIINNKKKESLEYLMKAIDNK